MSGGTEKGRSWEELDRAFAAFIAAHPELEEAFGLWMADAETAEAVDPNTAAIFAEHFPELLD